MQQYITLEILEDAGINIPVDKQEQTIERLNTMLEERVGAEIAALLDEEQLEEMVKVQQEGSEEDLEKWLSANLAELDKLAQDELDILLGEIVENEDFLTE